VDCQSGSDPNRVDRFSPNLALRRVLSERGQHR
jgi:hypothetical protein